MSKEWIIDVLGDLRGFAIANAMPTLAEELEEVIVVAVMEIEQSTQPIQAGADGAKAERYIGAAV